MAVTPTMMLIGSMRNFLAIYRDPSVSLNQQIGAQRAARHLFTNYVANVGHADICTAQRMAKIMLEFL